MDTKMERYSHLLHFTQLHIKPASTQHSFITFKLGFLLKSLSLYKIVLRKPLAIETKKVQLPIESRTKA